MVTSAAMKVRARLAHHIAACDRPQLARGVSVERATVSPAREKCRPHPPHGQAPGLVREETVSRPEQLIDGRFPNPDDLDPAAPYHAVYIRAARSEEHTAE